MKLREILKKVAEQVSPAHWDRARCIKTLLQQLDDYAQRLPEELAQCMPPEEGGATSITHIGFDRSGFSDEELAPVREKIAALHDFFMEKDHFVNIEFQDRASMTFSPETDPHAGPALVIAFNTGWTYDSFSHPHKDQVLLNKGFLKPAQEVKPAAPGPM
jgi:hypothetical protein